MDRAGDILKQVFSSEDGGRGEKYLPLFKNWRSIVGPELADRVTLRDIRRDALMIEVVHPGWLQAVMFKRKAILSRINSLYPGIGIKELKASVVRKPAKRVILPGRPEKAETGASTAAVTGREIDEMLSKMNENDLKRALKKLFSTQRKRKSD